MNGKYVWMDGQWFDEDQAVLPITDAVIQRGVGVFDLARSYGQGLIQLKLHMKRLLASAQKISIVPQWTLAQLCDLARQCRKKIDGEVLLKMYITGGDHLSEQGFDRPRLFVTVEPLQRPDPKVYQQGVRLCPLNRGRSNPTAKTVDYAAGFEVGRLDPGAFEGLYCVDGRITEAVHSTFYAVQANRLVTAPDSAVLAGTTRTLVLELAQKLGLTLDYRLLPLEELSCVDEAFISGSVKGLVPVVQVGSQTIGSGNVGPWAKKISALLEAELASWAE